MSTIEGLHCIQDTSPGLQGVHNRGAPLYITHTVPPPPPGKWTTYRSMAMECVDRAVEVGGLADEKGCQTDGFLLEGGDGWYPTLFIRLIQDYGLDVEVCF